MFAPLFSPLKLLLAAEISEELKPAISGTGNFTNTVFFTAKDSVVYNFDNRNMELCGKATIDHEGTRVQAPKIVIDLDTSQLHAYGTKADSSRTLAEPAIFTDKQGSFHAETMAYNFKTRKGETTMVSSSSKGVNFTGEHVSRLENGEMIVKESMFTTCNDDSPHYWFSSSSMVIKPDGKVTASPLIMYIRPEIFSRRLPALPILALPYMAFSPKESRSSGFLMPHLSHYDQSNYLSNLGYYWAINDYSDFRAEGDIALNGSWRLGELFRYTKRDEFAGNISGEYRWYFKDPDHQRYTDWNSKIVHNQIFDPSSRLDVNLQFQGGVRNYDLNSVNVETIVAEQVNSYASFAKTFNNENGIVDVTYNHSQDISNQNGHKNGRQSVSTTFYQNRIYPFRSSFDADNKDWRSDISVNTSASLSGEYISQANLSSSGYSGYANGELGYYHEFADGYKALFTQGFNLQGMQPVSPFNDNTYSGMRLLLPLRMQSTLFHYFYINPSLTYMHSLRSDGMDSGFSTTILSVDLSTRLYGIVKTGILEDLFGLKAVRHTFIPVITYTWNPVFSGNFNNSGLQQYDWTDSGLFSWFEDTRYSGVPQGQSTVRITLKNIFQGKFSNSSFSGDEGAPAGEHTEQLLSLSVSTACNFAAEAFRLAPLTIIGSSNALTQNFLFSSGAMYDFYSYDSVTGERVNRFNSSDGNGLLRFIKGFVNMSMNIQGGSQTGASTATSVAPFVQNANQSLSRNYFNMRDFNSTDYMLPWQFSLSLFMQSDRSTPLLKSEDKMVNVASRVALSKRWQTGFNTGYDLENKKFVFPMLQIYRDLHCWQFGFQWVPSGAFRSVAFQIGLKSPVAK